MINNKERFIDWNGEKQGVLSQEELEKLKKEYGIEGKNKTKKLPPPPKTKL